MKHTIYEKMMSVVSQYKSTKHESTLVQDGELTPEEFVIAGDSLISVCPNWSWAPADPSKKISILPDDKQFLINRGVVCRNRASDLYKEVDNEVELEDGWVQAGEKSNEEVVDLDDDNDVVDLDDIDLDEVEPDAEVNGDNSENDPNSRTYNVYIVYDRYYNVPHVFLSGVNSKGQQLTEKEMYEDISADHVEKTVTFEDHHMLNMKCLSIHPCKHSHVMKGLIDRSDEPKSFCAPLYFFTFLKFIHTVIPTIDISTPTIELNH